MQRFLDSWDLFRWAWASYAPPFPAPFIATPHHPPHHRNSDVRDFMDFIEDNDILFTLYPLEAAGDTKRVSARPPPQNICPPPRPLTARTLTHLNHQDPPPSPFPEW